MRRPVLIFFLAVLSLCTAVRALAVPARPGIIKIHQPDGKVLEVIIRGDENGHVMTTTDGCAIMRGSDGYCCYARFEPDGSRTCTGVRVGEDALGHVEALSRFIPYDAISRTASARRLKSSLSRMGRTSSLVTRAPSVHRAIIILAQFPDLSFTNDRSAFVNLVTAKGYSYRGATGSVLDYFNDQFQGQAEFEFEVGPVVTLSKSYSYYGKDDKDGFDLHPAEAVAEACRKSDAQVDFSRYDYVFLFYAGGNPADGGADDDHFWPHSWNLEDAGIKLTLDGKTLGAYSMSSELMLPAAGSQMEFASIGTFCHEYSHILGLVDMYDVDNERSGGQSKALWGTTSIMDAGNYNNDGRTPPGYNAIELEMLGLVKPEMLALGDYTLEPVNSTRRVLRMDTDTKGEYFLFEARQALGWDKYIGGSGLLVYHIDRSDRRTGYSAACERVLTAAERWDLNEVNANPDYQCADLVEAYSRAEDASKVFFPYSTLNYLSSKSNSGFRYWSGEPSLKVISKIVKTNGTVTFSVNGPLVIDSKDVFQDAVILNWHTDMDDLMDRPAYVRWTSGGRIHEAKVEPYGAGLYSYTVEGLDGGTDYTISVSIGSGQNEASAKVDVTTKTVSGQPFIYLSSASRNSAGKFTVCTKIPLRVYNLRGARSVRWYWNGDSITAGGDGYFELLEDGDLKAVVTYNDGTEEIFVKKISIR